MITFKSFLTEAYPPDKEIRKKIDYHINQKGVPKQIAIAKGWIEYKSKKTININDRNNLDNNPYYKAKQGIN